MTLSGTDNFNHSDRQVTTNENIRNFDVYGEQNEKIGNVIGVERTGLEPPHVIVEAGSRLNSRQVLLPLRNHRVDLNAQRLYLQGWNREKVNQLPPYLGSQGRVEVVPAILETPTPLESEVPLEAPFIKEIHSYTTSSEPIHLPLETAAPPSTINTTINSNRATQIGSTTRISAEEVIPLWAERLIVDRHKRKAGEVVVRKVIETEVIEVIVRREKLIVEQVSPEYKELATIDLGRISVEENASSQLRKNTL